MVHAYIVYGHRVKHIHLCLNSSRGSLLDAAFRFGRINAEAYKAIKYSACPSAVLISLRNIKLKGYIPDTLLSSTRCLSVIFELKHGTIPNINICEYVRMCSKLHTRMRWRRFVVEYLLLEANGVQNVIFNFIYKPQCDIAPCKLSPDELR